MLVHPNEVESISFYVLGDEDNQADSRVSVEHRDSFKFQKPIPGGVYDPRMGTTSKGWDCETCYNKKSKCDGHFGSLVLNYPVKNPIFIDQLLKWLKVICFDCGNIATSKEIIRRSEKSNLLTTYAKNTPGGTTCAYCKEIHPTVSKNSLKPNMFNYSYVDDTDKKELFNHEILDILERITPETLDILGKPLTSHPKKFIISILRVSPNTTRPEAKQTAGTRSSSPDTTALLKNIIEQNNILPSVIPSRDAITNEIADIYYSVDALVTTMIKGNATGTNQVKVKTSTHREPISIGDRLKTKSGRYRGNIFGKRCKEMGRSIIIGDNYIAPDELGIPVYMAIKLTIPETVLDRNIDALNIYFLNRGTYPGCNRIIKKEDGFTYNIKYLDENYRLRVGDIIYRHMVDGDVVNFNRQPSLTYASVSAHYVKVLKDSSAIRMNVSSCVFYNADFDGDAMNVIKATSLIARHEIAEKSMISNWALSLQDSSCMVGVIQDALIGTAELTTSGIQMDKWHAMAAFANIQKFKGMNFSQKFYTGKEIVSKIIPNVNLTNAKTTHYKKQYNTLIKYNPDDIVVNIVKGNLVSGILDKSTIGEKTHNSLFHVVAKEYGGKKTFDLIHNFHKLSSSFLRWKGFTTGLGDTVISDHAREEIRGNREKMYVRSNEITKKMDNGKLVCPIGVTLSDYYEIEQVNALEPADDYINPILRDTNFETNNLSKLIMYGSKGKSTNFININGTIGTSRVNGRRPREKFAHGRTLPYFQRYETSPESQGYVPTSYKEGISPQVYVFAAAEARDAFVSNATGTPIAGNQNRLAVKCLESIVIDNLRSASKPNALVQPLYAECGLDPRKFEKINFPSVMSSTAEFEERYSVSIKEYNTRYNNKTVISELKSEYEVILADRELYRSIFMKLSENNPRSKVFFNGFQNLTVNVERIISNVIADFSEDSKLLSKPLDPINAIEQVKQLCVDIDYCHFNKNWEVNRRQIPEYIKKSTMLIKILFRSVLNTKNLIALKVNGDLLEMICQRIRTSFKLSLVEYGFAIGIISAQCLSEPLTQYVLNSKHRAGGLGGSKTSTIDRLQEILGARPTDKMKNPAMTLTPLAKYRGDKKKVQEIANHIEMARFSTFVVSTAIFFEDYGNPVHKEYVHEKNIIQQFEKYSQISPPLNLSKWCIRFELSKRTMLIKSMTLDTIMDKFHSKYPDIHFVYTSDNAKKVIIRCYLKQNLIRPKTDQTNESFVIEFMKVFSETVIRGVEGVINTYVFPITKPTYQPDGSVKTDTVYAISTDGTNLKEMFKNKDLNMGECSTDSIVEYMEIFGISATRDKIIDELMNLIDDLSIMIASVYADEMTYDRYTSIHRSGMQAREMENSLLRMAFVTPIKALEDISSNGYTSQVNGMSGKLIMGGAIEYGTLFNKIAVNQSFVKNNATNLIDNLDSL
jgi:DNA-directed RNA polymerase II subunit RPB1